MGTVIERVALTEGGWLTRRSALRLAVKSAKDCLERAGRDPDDVELLVNAGIYRDRNLGEPAMAAMIQQDIGANPEDPPRRRAGNVLLRHLQRHLRSAHRAADRRRFPEVQSSRLRTGGGR